MIVSIRTPSMFFESKAEKVEVHFSQKMVVLARTLAVNPELVDRLDTETMILRRRKTSRQHEREGLQISS